MESVVATIGIQADRWALLRTRYGEEFNGVTGMGGLEIRVPVSERG